MVHLITGYAGKEHIQSADARSFNMAMFGEGEFVMEIGEQIDASIISNSTVRVFDGDILMQGGHIRIETDTYEDLTIQTGAAGKNRNDLIVMTYEKNSTDGVETAYLEVIKGTETSGTPSDPSYVSGNIAAGDTKNQMPLYRVKVEGVVLSELEALFETIPTYKTLAEEAEEKFEEACETYLDSLNILDSQEEIEANTQENQLAGALGVKEGFASLETDIASLEETKRGGQYWSRTSNEYVALTSATSWKTVLDLIPNVGDVVTTSITSAAAQSMNTHGLIPVSTGGIMEILKPLDGYGQVRFYTGTSTAMKLYFTVMFGEQNTAIWHYISATKV